MIYIYGLVDPETHEVCYVGQKNNLRGRLSGHVRDGSPAVSEWVKTLKTKGYFPIQIVFEKLEENLDAVNSEQWWISHGLRMGWPLLNKITVLRHVNVGFTNRFSDENDSSDSGKEATTYKIDEETAQLVRELYLDKGYSKNAIIRRFWPTMSKQKALAFINAATQRQEVTQ